MMIPERPDLDNVSPDVLAYIEALESELAQLRSSAASPTRARPSTTEPVAAEPPTTRCIITISRDGFAKRTVRHLYSPQRRGGMGVFDLDTTEDDAPALVAHADAGDTLLLFTDDGRAFRLPVESLPDSPVRARGASLRTMLPLRAHERIVAALPDGQGQFIALISQRGWVRRVRAAYLGRNLIPGTSFHDLKEGGPLVGACWTLGDQHLLLASRSGKGIRFLETQVPARGCLGIRLDVDDAAIGVASVDEPDGAFLLGHDGQGTIRLMSGFAANKGPGAGGKVLMKTDRLISVNQVRPTDDLFVLSRLGKLIRFTAAEVPPKEGVVQGVGCISLRADEAVGAAVAPPADTDAPDDAAAAEGPAARG